MVNRSEATAVGSCLTIFPSIRWLGLECEAFAQFVPSWTQATPVGPIPHRYNYPAIPFDESRGKAVIFGGQYEEGGWSRETWKPLLSDRPQRRAT